VWAWQFFAAGIVLFLIARGALNLRQSRRLTEIVFVLLLVPIPAAGFILFALHPGPPPELTLLTWVSSFLVVLGLYPAFYGRHALQHWRSSTVTPARITFVNRHILMARSCFVLGVSGYVSMFEPWFGIANLVATALWVAIWIPERWRAKKFEISAEVRATPEATFRHLIDASNWARYQADLQEVTTHPDGPLALGSEFTTRRSLASNSPQPSLGPASLEATFKVTAMTSTSFTTVLQGRKDSGTTELQPAQSATRVTGRGVWLLPITDAILGQALEMQAAIAARRQMSLESYKKLDQALADHSLRLPTENSVDSRSRPLT
jgi:hypothetical protein